jgi:hypothetical protein
MTDFMNYVKTGEQPSSNTGQNLLHQDGEHNSVLVLCQRKEGIINGDKNRRVENIVVPKIEEFVSKFFQKNTTIEYLVDNVGGDYNFQLDNRSDESKKFINEHIEHYSLVILNTCPFYMMPYELIFKILKNDGLMALTAFPSETLSSQFIQNSSFVNLLKSDEFTNLFEKVKNKNYSYIYKKKILGQDPSQKSNQPFDQDPSPDPGQNLCQTINQTSVKTPDQNLCQTLCQTIKQTIGQTSVKTPDQDTSQNLNQTIVSNPIQKKPTIIGVIFKEMIPDEVFIVYSNANGLTTNNLGEYITKIKDGSVTAKDGETVYFELSEQNETEMQEIIKQSNI